MLISFSINNFLSFDAPIEFVMSAGASRELLHHVVKGSGRNRIDILKSAIIYGANASGKSNFIKAVAFCQQIVVKGLLDVVTENKYFRLDATNIDKTTQFEFEFSHQGKLYAYGVVLSLRHQKVKEEWLFELLKTTDKPIFERKVLENGKSDIQIGIKLDRQGENRFEVYKKDIKDTQLFLSEINDKNIDDITNIASFQIAFDWFKHQLVVIYPDTKLTGLGFVGNDAEMKRAFCYFLEKFQTGIQDIETVEQDIDKNLPKLLQEKILMDLRDENMKSVQINMGKSSFNISKNENGLIKMYKLMTKRAVKNAANMVSFEIADESDGTQRIMDFIPALVALAKTNKTYLIDEIDRSLHPELTQRLLATFFDNTQNIESQLIATTHESSLLDLAILRRDEIWFVEKNELGASDMYSLEQFKPRYDKDVRKAYLQGRFGALPFVANIKNFIEAFAYSEGFD